MASNVISPTESLTSKQLTLPQEKNSFDQFISDELLIARAIMNKDSLSTLTDKQRQRIIKIRDGINAASNSEHVLGSRTTIKSNNRLRPIVKHLKPNVLISQSNNVSDSISDGVPIAETFTNKNKIGLIPRGRNWCIIPTSEPFDVTVPVPLTGFEYPSSKESSRSLLLDDRSTEKSEESVGTVVRDDVMVGKQDEYIGISVETSNLMKDKIVKERSSSSLLSCSRGSLSVGGSSDLHINCDRDNQHVKNVSSYLEYEANQESHHDSTEGKWMHTRVDSCSVISSLPSTKKNSSSERVARGNTIGMQPVPSSVILLDDSTLEVKGSVTALHKGTPALETYLKKCKARNFLRASKARAITDKYKQYYQEPKSLNHTDKREDCYKSIYQESKRRREIEVPPKPALKSSKAVGYLNHHLTMGKDGIVYNTTPNTVTDQWGHKYKWVKLPCLQPNNFLVDQIEDRAHLQIISKSQTWIRSRRRCRKIWEKLSDDHMSQSGSQAIQQERESRANICPRTDMAEINSREWL